MPLIAERYRAVAIDTPCFGQSDPPAQPVQIAEYTRAVVAVLDALGIQLAHVAGFHTGASIALDLASAHPERTASMILAGVLACEKAEERERWCSEIVKPWQADGRGEFVVDQAAFLQLYLPEEDGEVFLLESVARLQADLNYRWTYDAVIDYPAYEHFQRVLAPTLVMNPTDDPIYDETKRAHAALSGSLYTEILGGVDTVTRYPREFPAAVLDFLDELAQVSGTMKVHQLKLEIDVERWAEALGPAVMLMAYFDTNNGRDWDRWNELVADDATHTVNIDSSG